MRRLLPWLTVGMLVALVTGAAVLSTTTAPSQLDVARGALPSNDPVAFAELSGAIGRTVGASSFTVVYRSKGDPYAKAVYQAPNRIVEFGPSSVIRTVGIGASMYFYLPAGPLAGPPAAFGAPPGAVGCSGWITSPLPPRTTEPYDDALFLLTPLRGPTIRVCSRSLQLSSRPSLSSPLTARRASRTRPEC